MLGVFLDIEKAYYMVWHHVLLQKLSKLGAKGRLFNFLRIILQRGQGGMNLHTKCGARRRQYNTN